MPYAIITVPVAPLRAEAAHRSEMLSQLLWGECVEITDTAAGGWVKVKNQYDDYEGWATASHLEEINEALYQAVPAYVTTDWANAVTMNGQPAMVPFGCLIKSNDPNAATWGNISVKFPGVQPAPLPGSTVDAEALKTTAFRYLNTAYLWGGRAVFGIDCSGFTQGVYKMMGVPLLRDAWQQATQGTVVDFLQEARLGDLAFFDNAEGRITHVGILLNEEEIIHASGKVRVDRIDNQGIIHAETGVRTHTLRIIKRYW